MTEQEYWKQRNARRLEQMYHEANMALMVKSGRDKYDGVPEDQQQAKADKALRELEVFIAKYFMSGEKDHQELINELKTDYRLVGDMSLFDFSKYATFMDRYYTFELRARNLEGSLITANREKEEVEKQLAIVQAKVVDATNYMNRAKAEFENAKADLAEERKRLGLDGSEDRGEGAGDDA